MKRVTRAEGDLLELTRALFVPDAYAALEPMLFQEIPLTKVGPTAMQLLEDTLAKGSVVALARLGGALPARGTVPVFATLPVPALRFGAYTFEVLHWMTSRSLALRTTTGPPRFERRPVTLGDELVAYLLLRLVTGRGVERSVVASGAVTCPLAWLGHARVLARHGNVSPSLEGLLGDVDRRTVVRCLSLDLQHRWAATTSWSFEVAAEEALRMVDAEEVVANAFLDDVAASGCWELATFLVSAGVRALPPGVNAEELATRATPPLSDEYTTVRVRSESRRRAGALYKALVRIGKQRESFGLVRFIDDGYEEAQAILSAWEVLPRMSLVRAAEVIAALQAIP